VDEDRLMIGLSAAGLLAVGLLGLMVWKIVAGLVQYRRAERKAGRTVTHPEFGVLTFGFGSWDGVARKDGREIRFTVAGSESAPDEGLLAGVTDLLRRFAEFEGPALDVLVKQEANLRREDFSFYGLNFLWPERPRFCALEFVLKGDDEGVWRVEFEGDAVSWVGRDD
jgi:hypothetical protein